MNDTTPARYVYGQFSDHTLRCPKCSKYVADTLRLATEAEPSAHDRLALMEVGCSGQTHQPCEEGRRLLATIFS